MNRYHKNKNSKKTIATWLPMLFLILFFGGAYYLNLQKKEQSLHARANRILKQEFKGIKSYSKALQEQLVNNNMELENLERSIQQLNDSISFIGNIITDLQNQLYKSTNMSVKQIEIPEDYSIYSEIEDLEYLKNVILKKKAGKERILKTKSEDYVLTSASFQKDMNLYLSKIIDETIFEYLDLKTDTFGTISSNNFTLLHKMNDDVPVKNSRISTRKTSINGVNYYLYELTGELFSNSGMVVLTGMILESEFNKKSREINTWVYIVFSVLLVLTAVYYPLLRLLFMNHLQSLDIRQYMVNLYACFLSGAIITVLIMLLQTSGGCIMDIKRNTERLNDDITLNFNSELEQIYQTLEYFDTTEINSIDTTIDYPFFKELLWIDSLGNVTKKIDDFRRTSKLPNLEQRAYVKEVNKWALPRDTNDYNERFMLESIYSWTDNQNEAAISIKKGKEIIALTTNLSSVMNTVMPYGYSFAIIDNDGKVLFHSKEFRNTRENFIEETLSNEKLLSSIHNKMGGSSRLQYRNQPHIVSVSSVQNTDLFIVTLGDLSILHARLTELLSGLTMVITIVIMTIIFFLFVFYISHCIGKSKIASLDEVFNWLYPNDKDIPAYKVIILHSLILMAFYFVLALFIKSPLKMAFTLTLLIVNYLSLNIVIQRKYSLINRIKYLLPPLILSSVPILIIFSRTFDPAYFSKTKTLVFIALFLYLMFILFYKPHFMKTYDRFVKNISTTASKFYSGTLIFAVFVIAVIPSVILFKQAKNYEHKYFAITQHIHYSKELKNKFNNINEAFERNIHKYNELNLHNGKIDTLMQQGNYMTLPGYRTHYERKFYDADFISDRFKDQLKKLSENWMLTFVRPVVSPLSISGIREPLGLKFGLDYTREKELSSQFNIEVKSFTNGFETIPITLKNEEYNILEESPFSYFKFWLKILFFIMLGIIIYLFYKKFEYIQKQFFVPAYDQHEFKREENAILTNDEDIKKEILNFYNDLNEQKTGVFIVNADQKNYNFGVDIDLVDLNTEILNIKSNNYQIRISDNKPTLIRGINIILEEYELFDYFIESCLYIWKNGNKKGLNICSPVNMYQIIYHYNYDYEFKDESEKNSFLVKLYAFFKHFHEKFIPVSPLSFEGKKYRRVYDYNLPILRMRWAALSIGEKLFLKDLAEDGYANLINKSVIISLLHKGVIKMDGNKIIFTCCEFKRFIISPEIKTELQVLKKEHYVMSRWDKIKLPLIITIIALILLVVFSKQGVLTSINTIIASLAGIAGIVINITQFAGGRFNSGGD